ncbi:hypothetical protein NAT51_15730 [Flavobacterium amniphilum]|nr:hypothetical protein [Flavobacterium amniphilum]
MSSKLIIISFPNVSKYASMKRTIETYTKCLARKLGNRQITTNNVVDEAIAIDFGGAYNNNTNTNTFTKNLSRKLN